MEDKEKLKRTLVCIVGAIAGILSMILFRVDISMKILIPLFVMLVTTVVLFLLFCDSSYEVERFRRKISEKNE